MGLRHTRLAASLAAAWEAEVVSARSLAALADQASDPKLKARLMVLSAFCRAHASRLLARLAALGRGPLPVPPGEIDVGDDVPEALRREAVAAKSSAIRYDSIATLARTQSDLSSAWVCELNRSEEEDRASELMRLAIDREREEELPRSETLGAGL